MNSNEVQRALEAAGTAQNRKVYARHGVREPMFGVSYATQRKLAKRLGTDDLLAVELWASGNHDARILATTIADPAATKRSRVEVWMKDLDNYVLTDALALLVAKSPDAPALRKKLIRVKGEWTSTLGWSMVAQACVRDMPVIEDELEDYLGIIEGEIHQRPNRTRYAMNVALIAIGCRGGELSKRAIAVAKRIGKVEVDHGETGCKTPDAAPYIERTLAHYRARPKARPAKKTRATKH